MLTHGEARADTFSPSIANAVEMVSVPVFPSPETMTSGRSLGLHLRGGRVG